MPTVHPTEKICANWNHHERLRLNVGLRANQRSSAGLDPLAVNPTRFQRKPPAEEFLKASRQAPYLEHLQHAALARCGKHLVEL